MSELKNEKIPEGMEDKVREDGITYRPAAAILRGVDDDENAYWNSFLPIFIDRINIITRRVMSDCVKEYGLTGIYANYLIALRLKGGLTLVELSRFLDIDAANTNRVIKVLKEKELVYDDRKTPKSKKFSVYLTEDGSKLADKIMSKTQECMNGFFKGIPKFSVDNMRYTLIKMLYNSDPGFEDYVDSEYINPFFTYLGLAWDEEDPDALKFGKEEYQK